jgi:hypothetical protein
MELEKLATGKSAAAVVAGCAAACVGVAVVPALVAGAVGGGFWALVSGDTWLALGVMGLSGAVWVVLNMRQNRAKAPPACQCAPDAGCHTGPSCELPTATPQ